MQTLHRRHNMPCDPEISLDIAAKISRGTGCRIMRTGPATADQQMPMRALLQRKMPAGMGHQMRNDRRHGFGCDHLLHQATHWQLHARQPRDMARPWACRDHHAPSANWSLRRAHQIATAFTRNRLYLQAAFHSRAGALGQLQKRRRSAQRINLAFGGAEGRTGKTMGQIRCQIA